MASGPQNATPNAGPAHDQTPPSSSVSWDGDRMFNIYIYDYCLKRGYQKTARELLAEADIPAESQPPINAKQGLLFEWWSVFWVLFTAKSSGQGSDDALLYVAHAQQNPPQRQPPPRIPQQTANTRFTPNGMASRPAGMPPTGPMPNGLSNPGAPPGQPPMPNGVGPSGQPLMQPVMRPGPNGPQQPPQRAPNGGPFQSPTIAHSPQQTGGALGAMSNQPGGGVPGMVGTQPPLTQMNRGNMLPPGAPGTMAGGPPQMMGQSGGPGQTSQQGFSQMGSQPGSPATQGNMSAPSPSMTHRQPSGGQQQQDPALAQVSELNKELSHLSNPVLAALRQELGLGDKDHLSLSVDEKRRIVELARMKGRLPPPKGQMQGGPSNSGGPSGQHMQPMTPQQRVMQMGHPQQPPQQQQGPPGQIPHRPKRSSASPGEEHGQLPKNESSPPASKRQRTSPGGPGHPSQQQQQGLPGPPPQHQQQPPMTPMLPYPPHPQQPGGPGGPHGMPNGMMNRPMAGMPFPGPPGGMQGMGNQPGMQGMPGMSQMGGPPMGGMNSPGLMHPGAPGMNQQGMNQQGINQQGMNHQGMNSQMQAQMQYRQTMHNLHKIPGTLNNMLPGNHAGSPPSDGQQFNPDGPHSRPGTGVPGIPGHYPQPGNPNAPSRPQQPGQPGKPMGVMMPPPSPGPKHVSGSDNKGPGPSPGDGSNAGASPRNAGMGQPPPGMQPNTGPPHPPLQQHQHQQQQLQHGGTGPPTPIPSNSLSAPSPPPSMMNPLGGGNHTTQDIFGADFMTSVSSSLEDFEFRPDTTMDFERDFGEWFSHPDQAGLEGKL